GCEGHGGIPLRKGRVVGCIDEKCSCPRKPGRVTIKNRVQALRADRPRRDAAARIIPPRWNRKPSYTLCSHLGPSRLRACLRRRERAFCYSRYGTIRKRRCSGAREGELFSEMTEPEREPHAEAKQPAAELLPMLYAELSLLAASLTARLAPGQTLQPTALVHEAYLRLVRDRDPGWEGRRHFFGAAAQAMREILIDQTRHKGSLKHGGRAHRVELVE